MIRRPLVLAIAGVSLMVALAGLSVGNQRKAAPAKAIAPLSDEEFWRLSSTFSEPDGTFHSENLVSNEAAFQLVLPKLAESVAPGRVYVGVGSEQNFSYIDVVQPSLAFIVDIRRGNLDLHLLYKAIFELSATRAEFVSRLFSRKRPEGLTTTSTAAEIFDRYAAVEPSDELYRGNLQDVYAHLTEKHGFALAAADKEGIDYVYRSWFAGGPEIHYELTNGFGGRRGPGGFPTYADLMTAADDTGRNRSFLANEENFTLVKTLESRNLVVPVVGNFGGAKALRAVGDYLKKRSLTVSAFYVSNVEQYLRQDGLWEMFCRNARTLPVDATSLFIRTARGGFAGQGFGGPGRGPLGFGVSLASIGDDLAGCAAH